MILPTRRKYGNQPVEVHGWRFDSLAEASRYQTLWLLHKAGEIDELTIHPRFLLAEGVRRADGTRLRPVYYVADFQYQDTATGKRVVEDVKGGEATKTAVYRLKKRLLLARYPDMDFREVEA